MNIDWNTSGNDWLLMDEGYLLQFRLKNLPILLPVQQPNQSQRPTHNPERVLDELSEDELLERLDLVRTRLLTEEVESQVELLIAQFGALQTELDQKFSAHNPPIDTPVFVQQPISSSDPSGSLEEYKSLLEHLSEEDFFQQLDVLQTRLTTERINDGSTGSTFDLLNGQLDLWTNEYEKRQG